MILSVSVLFCSGQYLVGERSALAIEEITRMVCTVRMALPRGTRLTWGLFHGLLLSCSSVGRV